MSDLPLGSEGGPLGKANIKVEFFPVLIGRRKFIEENQAGPSLEHVSARLGLFRVIKVVEDLRSEGNVMDFKQDDYTA